MHSIFHRWQGVMCFLFLALTSAVISGAIFISVQQVYRSGANDPQIEAAQTLQGVLEQGIPAEAITGQGESVDMENSLSLFISVFDKERKLVTSSGVLGEESPTPPSSVFDAMNNGQQRFTWEPKPGVRIAAVAQKLNGDSGYLLVGRNMKEVDMRIQDLMVVAGGAFAAMLILSALSCFVLCKKPRHHSHHHEPEGGKPEEAPAGPEM